MVEVLGEIVTKLRADIDDLKRDFRQAARETRGLGGAASDAERRASGAFAGMSHGARRLALSVGGAAAAFLTIRGAIRALRGAAGILADVTRAAEGQENAVALLNQTLRSTGQFTRGYSLELQRLAASFQRVTTVGDEVVLAQQRQLIAFGATRENIGRVTEAALDLSAGLGTDVKAAVLLLGKALAGEFSTLSRYGIFVDENASKTEKLEQALTQIQTRFGGQARAAALTFQGRVEGLSNAWSDLKEQIGFTITKSDAWRDAIGLLTQHIVSASGEIESFRSDADALELTMQGIATATTNAAIAMVGFSQDAVKAAITLQENATALKLLLDISAGFAFGFKHPRLGTALVGASAAIGMLSEQDLDPLASGIARAREEAERFKAELAETFELRNFARGVEDIAGEAKKLVSELSRLETQGVSPFDEAALRDARRRTQIVFEEARRRGIELQKDLVAQARGLGIVTPAAPAVLPAPPPAGGGAAAAGEDPRVAALQNQIAVLEASLKEVDATGVDASEAIGQGFVDAAEQAKTAWDSVGESIDRSLEQAFIGLSRGTLDLRSLVRQFGESIFLDQLRQLNIGQRLAGILNRGGFGGLSATGGAAQLAGANISLPGGQVGLSTAAGEITRAAPGAAGGAAVGAAGGPIGLAIASAVMLGTSGLSRILGGGPEGNAALRRVALAGPGAPAALIGTGLSDILGLKGTGARVLTGILSSGFSELSNLLAKVFGIGRGPTAQRVIAKEIGRLFEELVGFNPRDVVGTGELVRPPGVPGAPGFAIPRDIAGLSIPSVLLQRIGLEGRRGRGSVDAAEAITAAFENTATALHLAAEDAQVLFDTVARGTAGRDLRDAIVRMESDLAEAARTDRDVAGTSLSAQREQIAEFARIYGDLPKAVDAARLSVLAFSADGRVAISALERGVEDAQQAIVGGLGAAFDELISTGDATAAGDALAEQFGDTFNARVKERLITEGVLGGPELTEALALTSRAAEALAARQYAEFQGLIAQAGELFQQGRANAERVLAELAPYLDQSAFSLGLPASGTTAGIIERTPAREQAPVPVLVEPILRPTIIVELPTGEAFEAIQRNRTRFQSGGGRLGPDGDVGIAGG